MLVRARDLGVSRGDEKDQAGEEEDEEGGVLESRPEAHLATACARGRDLSASLHQVEDHWGQGGWEEPVMHTRVFRHVHLYGLGSLRVEEEEDDGEEEEEKKGEEEEQKEEEGEEEEERE